MKFSFAPLLHWTPLGVSVKQEEQLWHLNMETIKLKTPVTSLYIVFSSCMDSCTFCGIWDTTRALANCWHPSFFSTFAVLLYSVFYLSLSLVSKLKLNSWVLWAHKSSSTHCGCSNTWISKVFHQFSTVKVLKYIVISVLGPPKFPCMSQKY